MHGKFEYDIMNLFKLCLIFFFKINMPKNIIMIVININKIFCLILIKYFLIFK